MLSKTLFSLILTLLFASLVLAQATAPKEASEVLKNIKIDVSTPEDVIKELGKPASDEMDELDAEYLDSWMKIKKNQKVFRKFTYKNIGETERILLRFYEDKLVKIVFIYKKDKDKRVLAADLPQKYNADFLIVRGILKDTKVSDFEGQRENTIPKMYGALYVLMSVQPDVIYTAFVSNDSFKTLWNNLKMKPTKEMFPGRLFNFAVISRTLLK